MRAQPAGSAPWTRQDAGPLDGVQGALIELVDVQEQVNEILGAETYVMTRDSLHPMLRPRIEAEALRVF